MNSLMRFGQALPGSSLAESLSMENLRTESYALRARFANLKSLGDFLDVKRVCKPQGWGDAQARINFNLAYYSSNYLIVFALLSIYSLLTNLLLLFVIVFVFVGMWGISRLHGEDLNLRFTRIPSSTLYTGLMVVAITLGFLASPLTTLLWLIGASAVLILGHATLMDKPIESAFAEEHV